MSQEVSDLQMHFLESHLNEEVQCVYWELGIQKEAKGVLRLVVPYDKINVGNLPIPFVGVNTAIEQVSINGTSIYVCPPAKGYQGCHAYDHFALVGAQMEILGKSIKLESLNKTYDNATPEMRGRY